MLVSEFVLHPFTSLFFTERELILIQFCVEDSLMDRAIAQTIKRWLSYHGSTGLIPGEFM
jgi:hypothetical protein